LLGVLLLLLLLATLPKRYRVSAGGRQDTLHVSRPHWTKHTTHSACSADACRSSLQMRKQCAHS
jgi:hypothetical protein